MERGGFSVQHPQHLKPPSLHSPLRGGGGGGSPRPRLLLFRVRVLMTPTRAVTSPPLLCKDTIAPSPTWIVLMVKQSWFFYWLMQIFKLQVVGQWPVAGGCVRVCGFVLFRFVYIFGI